MRLGLLVVLILCTQVFSESYNASLLLTWMGGHCKMLGTTCDREKYDQWDHQSFTIHGLRLLKPSKYYYGPFNFELLRQNHSLLDMMYNYWPPQPKLNGPPHFLWKYEWDKYGHRFSQMFVDNYQIYVQNFQFSFFSVTMQMYKNLNVRKLSKSVYTKSAFATLLKIPEDSFYFVCSKSGIFVDLKICYQLDWKPAQRIITRKCGSSEKDMYCKSSTIRLEDYKKEGNEIDIVPLSDAHLQFLKNKNELIYVPQAEVKEDQYLEKIHIDTRGKREPMSDEERARMGEDDEQYGFVDDQLYGYQEFTSACFQTIKVTAILVSVFWLALFIWAIRCWRKCTKKVHPPQYEILNVEEMVNGQDLKHKIVLIEKSSQTDIPQ